MSCFISEFIYIFLYLFALFKDAVNISVHLASNGKMISES